jgi:hypothetical protein
MVLRDLESDYFTGTTLNLLWSWTESTLRSGGRRAVDDQIMDAIEALFRSLPVVRVRRTARRERLEELLALPVWRFRHRLYQAWLLPAIESALFDYPVEIHAPAGTLSFRFQESRLATFTTDEGPVKLVAEHRSPLANPRGAGRLANIQPDYILASPGEEDRARVVIEVKHYRRPDSRSFADVLTDYAEGQPEAEIILADYGPMSKAVLTRVPERLRPRAHPIGDVRPRSSPLEWFVELIRAAMPPPPGAGPMPPPPSVEMVVVDVSGSMSGELSRPGVRKALRALCRGESRSHLAGGG